MLYPKGIEVRTWCVHMIILLEILLYMHLGFSKGVCSLKKRGFSKCFGNFSLVVGVLALEGHLGASRLEFEGFFCYLELFNKHLIGLIK